MRHSSQFALENVAMVDAMLYEVKTLPRVVIAGPGDRNKRVGDRPAATRSCGPMSLHQEGPVAKRHYPPSGPEPRHGDYWRKGEFR